MYNFVNCLEHSVVTLLQMTLCIEQKSQPTEGATQQEDVSRSYRLMQQQLKQANDTIATATEHMRRVQETTSQLFIETVK